MSVEKISSHNTKKMPFLLPDKKHECSHINSLCNTTAILQDYL